MCTERSVIKGEQLFKTSRRTNRRQDISYRGIKESETRSYYLAYLNVHLRVRCVRRHEDREVERGKQQRRSFAIVSLIRVECNGCF